MGMFNVAATGSCSSMLSCQLAGHTGKLARKWVCARLGMMETNDRDSGRSYRHI